MKQLTYKKITVLLLSVFVASSIYAFESGPYLTIGGTFGGSFTLPNATSSVLNDLNPLASSMKGTMSKMLGGGYADIGYIFAPDKFSFLPKNSFFSGFGVFGTVGVEQGSTGQKITAAMEGTGQSFDIFMTVDFLPVVSAGLTAKAWFFETLGIGLSTGTRIIADMNPQYLLYTTLPDDTAETLGLQKQVGNIIVTEDMMKNMNPFMFYAKLLIDYSIPLSHSTSLVLGGYGRYNLYSPRYLTMPSNLRKIVVAAGGNPDKVQPDYWLNSVDFGISIGLTFKLQKPSTMIKNTNTPYGI